MKLSETGSIRIVRGKEHFGKTGAAFTEGKTYRVTILERNAGNALLEIAGRKISAVIKADISGNSLRAVYEGIKDGSPLFKIKEYNLQKKVSRYFLIPRDEIPKNSLLFANMSSGIRNLIGLNLALFGKRPEFDEEFKKKLNGLVERLNRNFKESQNGLLGLVSFLFNKNIDGMVDLKRIIRLISDRDGDYSETDFFNDEDYNDIALKSLFEKIGEDDFELLLNLIVKNKGNFFLIFLENELYPIQYFSDGHSFILNFFMSYSGEIEIIAKQMNGVNDLLVVIEEKKYYDNFHIEKSQEKTFIVDKKGTTVRKILKRMAWFDIDGMMQNIKQRGSFNAKA